MPATVDLILLSRDLSPPREDVWRSVEAQQGVQIVIHRVAGPQPAGRPQPLRHDMPCPQQREAPG